MSVLVIASFDGSDASYIGDFLFAFNAYSRHRCYYIVECRRLDSRFDFSPFDVVLVFWSASLLGPDLAPGARRQLARARAAKVVMVQDEHRDVERLREGLREIGARVVLSCVAAGDLERVYPARAVPGLEAVHSVLPGYVPARLERRGPGWERERSVDLSYRSRRLPYYLGDLARSKTRLAERFATACAARGLRADISVEELDRLYGTPWIRFLERSRCVLGSPSGASVVDFTGRIQRDCEAFLARHPGADYEEVKSRFFGPVDGRLTIDTVSPRTFEAAALGCTLVQTQGAYAGVLEAGRHYLPIAPDLTDLETVLDGIQDRTLCRRLASQAHRDLVESGAYGYRRFVAWFDDVVQAHATRGTLPAPSRARFYADRLLRHGQSIVPVGEGYAVWPFSTAALSLAARRLPLAPGRPGPYLGRLLRSPGEFARKVAACLRLVLATPEYRSLLGIWARYPVLRGCVPVWSLLDDLLKLDVARRALHGGLATTTPFGVVVLLDAALGGIELRSRTGASKVPWGAADLEATLASGAVTSLVWDHSRVGYDVAYQARPGRWLSLGVGPGGVRRFEAIAALLRAAPKGCSVPLASLLASGRDA